MGSRRGLEAEPHLKVLAKLSGQEQADTGGLLREGSTGRGGPGCSGRGCQSGSRTRPRRSSRLARLDMSAGDKPGAVRTIDEVVAAHPTNIEALVSRAGVLAEEGKHDGALEVLKKALAVDARSPSVHFALGKLHLLRRDTTAALGAFGQVVKNTRAIPRRNSNSRACTSNSSELEDVPVHSERGATCSGRL